MILRRVPWCQGGHVLKLFCKSFAKVAALECKSFERKLPFFARKLRLPQAWSRGVSRPSREPAGEVLCSVKPYLDIGNSSVPSQALAGYTRISNGLPHTGPRGAIFPWKFPAIENPKGGQISKRISRNIREAQAGRAKK